MDPNGEQRGESWMPNTSAWPNDASVCSLSQVLTISRIPQKYFLSGKACAGILRRAERRGKELPIQLRQALRAVAGELSGGAIPEGKIRLSPCASTPKAGGGRIDAESETFVVISLDPRNATRDPEKHDEHNRQGCGVGAEGEPSPTLTKEFVPGVAVGVHGDVAHTLNAHQAGSVQEDRIGHGVPIVTHSLRAEGHDASEDGTGRGVPLVPIAWDEEINAHVDISGTVIRGGNGGRHAGVLAFAQNSRDESRLLNGDGRIAGALAAETGMKQQTYLAVERDEAHVMTLAIRGRGDSSDFETRTDGTANALLTPNGGRGGIGVGAVAYSIQAGATRENAESGPDGVGVQADLAYTIEARQEVQAVANMAVRRLLPVECERLQGFPDGYTLIPGYDPNKTGEFGGNKGVADGPRYRALGNSMAVPCMAWIGRRIQEDYAND